MVVEAGLIDLPISVNFNGNSGQLTRGDTSSYLCDGVVTIVTSMLQLSSRSLLFCKQNYLFLCSKINFQRTFLDKAKNWTPDLWTTDIFHLIALLVSMHS